MEVVLMEVPDEELDTEDWQHILIWRRELPELPDPDEKRLLAKMWQENGGEG